MSVEGREAILGMLPSNSPPEVAGGQGHPDTQKSRTVFLCRAGGVSPVGPNWSLHHPHTYRLLSFGNSNGPSVALIPAFQPRLEDLCRFQGQKLGYKVSPRTARNMLLRVTPVTMLLRKITSSFIVAVSI